LRGFAAAREQQLVCPEDELMDLSTHKEVDWHGRPIDLGPVQVNMPSASMRKGDVVVAHQHNFDHPTQAFQGAFLIDVLDVRSVDAKGRPVDYSVVSSKVVSENDPIPFFLIRAGTWHRLTALEDGSRYMCFYAHRKVSALTLHAPGQQNQPPYFKRDEKGVLWRWVDETIIDHSVQWPEAYR
jgi:hypothetical protein